LGKQVLRVADDAMQLLCNFPWPGNVRQLQAVVRQGVLQTTGPVLLAAFLPEIIRRGGNASKSPGDVASEEFRDKIEAGLAGGSRTLYVDIISDVERQLITRVLQHTAGNQSEAAAALGITRTTLRVKIEKLGITIERIVQSDG
jgi:two-component system nitrogen regulation response regulator GlnG